MKKEKLFLSLLTAALSLPSTFFVPSLVLAEEMEETTLSKINLDDASQ